MRVEYRQPGAGGGAQLAWIPPADVLLVEAEKIIRDSDVAILCVGLSSDLEGEEMRGMNIPGFLGGDRTSLDLPEPQIKASGGGNCNRQTGSCGIDQRQRDRCELRRRARDRITRRVAWR